MSQPPLDLPAPTAERIVQPPTVTKAPPTGRKFPCPACGARLDFDPNVTGLKCPYCGYTEVIERDDSVEVSERDYGDYLNREEGKGKAITGRSTQTRCPGCGAIVLLEDKVATENCPFCSTHLESKPEDAKSMIPPESLLPFRVDLRKARAQFTDWLHGLWFAPNELRTVANLGQLNGVYLPYWTYDTMTYTRYTGQRGVNYTTTETYTETGSDGRSETKTRTVVRTQWFYVSGEVQHFFDDVLVCGSKSIPVDLVDDLPPWDLEKLDPFRPEYLSGFKTERYAIGLKEGFATAKTIMESTIDTLIRHDIGGDHQRIDTKQTRYSAITFKHLLLPMWIAVYRYHEATFQILVNGRTGKVTGYRPYSWSKIAGWVMLATMLLAVIAFVVMKMQH